MRPDRIGSIQARRYSWHAIIDARIVSALRAGGHRIPTIAAVLERLRDYANPTDADELLAVRLKRIAERSIALLEASASLRQLIRGT
ncbi:hypothetical protein BWO91_14300 [Plantibacter flavus]|uniref:hypothetical protein n=1 Tax=Plantibacter flavus TaxID=150123 RepID=UPI00099B4D7A|nr:hypothetical protein [Plantibacter flavus]AQX80979.1 hypothetical protein BWO91_14300 [Plantibacter flavus]